MRLWLSLAMLVTGASLLVGAGFAGNDTAQLRKGGIFRVGTTGASVQVDPQLAYITTAWWLEYATAAKLYNYPDRRGPSGNVLVPEVASRFTVSNGGRTYTFFIRKGFRFSDGEPVTAKSFKRAINRVANKDLDSPGAAFIITDPLYRNYGTNIVGAKDVHDGYGTDVRGVRVRGNRLIIHLTEPDGAFLSKITMPFFQATSKKLRLDREIVNVDDVDVLPSAGPYAFSRNDVNQLTSIRQNPFWKRGPGRMRPRNLAGLDLHWNLNEQTAFHQTNNNELDEGPLPAAEVIGVANRYGLNKTRFWTKPVNCTGYLPMNMANHLFKGNSNLRKAVSYAVDRRAYVAQAGPYAGEPWSHLLNPGVPGWRNVNLYPLDKPDLTKARQLAAGHLRDGKITVYYRSSGTTNPAQAAIVRQDLINIGFEPANITMKNVYGGIYDPMGRKGNDADIAVGRGWCSDYPDPYDWINILLDGKTIRDENNTNLSYMDLPKWNRKMEAAAMLVGPKRFKVYGQLDLDIMKQVAPMAAMRTYNNRYFFSNRVNPKSLVYQGIYQDWSIPALALK
jgi:oligopeptide transport system substrate-binding protein